MRLALVVLGGVAIAAGLIFSYTAIGGFKEDVGITADLPYDPIELLNLGWSYEEYLLYVKADYEYLNNQYSAACNYTLGALSPGSVIRIDYIQVYSKSVGWRWTSNGTKWEEFHPDETECNATAWILLYDDSARKWSDYTELGSDAVVMGEREEQAHWVEEYEVKREGLRYTLCTSGNGNRPFGVVAGATVVTLYGRAAPFLMIGGIVLIVVALIGPYVHRTVLSKSIRGKELQ